MRTGGLPAAPIFTRATALRSGSTRVRDDRRGIIAFGEVLTDPEMRDLSDDDHTYWIDSDGKAAALRVRVRYVIKPSEPLWLELAPADSVIRQLPVSRAQGGTAHHVTADQWAQLMALVGGWPRPDAGEDDGGIWLGRLRRFSRRSPHTSPCSEPSSRASHTSRPTSTARCRLQQDDRVALWSTSSRTSALFSGTSAFHTFWATGHSPTCKMRCVLRWSDSSLATRRSRASSRKCPHLTCPQRRGSWRSIHQSWLRQAPAVAAETTVGVDYLERQARNRDVGLKGEHPGCRA